MAQALDELIAKLEAATTDDARCRAGPLNAAIATAIWGEPKPSGPPEGPKTLHWWHGGVGRSIAPDFVNSLDAALLTKPEGANCYGFDADPNEVLAYWSRNSVATGHWIAESRHAHSVPIALCIAALRARATTGEDNG